MVNREESDFKILKILTTLHTLGTLLAVDVNADFGKDFLNLQTRSLYRTKEIIIYMKSQSAARRRIQWQLRHCNLSEAIVGDNIVRKLYYPCPY